MGQLNGGLHPPTVNKIASEIKKVHETGVEVCLVIGGGNIFRGLQGSAQGMERTTADYMGMLATVMNSLAMQSELEKININTRSPKPSGCFFVKIHVKSKIDDKPIIKYKLLFLDKSAFSFFFGCMED